MTARSLNASPSTEQATHYATRFSIMVTPEKKDQALQALHRVLTGTRKMALEAQSNCCIAEVLD